MNIRPETIKLLEENIESKLTDINLGNDFFGFDNKSKDNKSKNKQVELHQTKELLQRKPSAKSKGHLWNGRKYLQIINLVRG